MEPTETIRLKIKEIDLARTKLKIAFTQANIKYLDADNKLIAAEIELRDALLKRFENEK